MKTKYSMGTVLVVDDNPKIIDILTASLEIKGYDVRSALTGTAALQSVREVIPEIVILDIMMPGIDGYEVCRNLKDDPSTTGVPVIFLSALGGEINKVKAFNVGAVDYITKPFHVTEVLARVEMHLDVYRVRHRQTRQMDKDSNKIDKQSTTGQVGFANDDERAAANEHVQETTESIRRLFYKTLDLLDGSVKTGVSKEQLASYLDAARKELDAL